jgi:hypothetical protein
MKREKEKKNEKIKVPAACLYLGSTGALLALSQTLCSVFSRASS